MLGKVEGSRKRGRPDMRWVDSLKVTTDISLQKQSGAVEDTTFWGLYIHGVAIGQGQLDTTEQQ